MVVLGLSAQPTKKSAALSLFDEVLGFVKRTEQARGG